jgi:transposase
LPPAGKPKGKKRGRKALPENLPRERVEYDIPDDQKACPCCRNQMHRMGEIVSKRYRAHTLAG